MNLITRSDFDGLACAVLLKEVEIIEKITFAHPRDIQDHSFEVTNKDILTNLPYHPNCGMWFDHHSSEEQRQDIPTDDFVGDLDIAPSAARVVYNYYNSKRLKKYDNLLEQVDKYDSANLDVKDVTSPKRWILLAYILDPRTGLGKYHDYGISNKNLMYKMIDLMSTHEAEEILAMYDVKQRVDLYFEQQEKFKKMIQETSKLLHNIIFTDTRGIGEIPTGNRFFVYTVYPDANISVRLMDGLRGKNVVVSIGHSIFNKTSKTDVGKLCGEYGGGGHRAVGTIQIDTADANNTVKEILERIKKDG